MTWITEIGFPVYLHYVEESDRIETPFYNQETGKVIPSAKFKVNLTKLTTTIDKAPQRHRAMLHSQSGCRASDDDCE